MKKIISKWCFWEYITINFHSNWDSLMFWQSMNWRNFVFVYFAIEHADYVEQFLIDFWLFGLGITFTWHFQNKTKRKEDLDNFNKELWGNK